LVFEVVARYFLGKKTGVSSGGTTFKSYSTLKSPSPHLCGDTIARFAVLSTYGLSTLKVIRTSWDAGDHFRCCENRSRCCRLRPVDWRLIWTIRI